MRPWGKIAVYLLISKGRVVYVGQSRSLRKRLSHHSEKVFDRVEVIGCDDSYWASVTELRLIAKLRPKYNRQHVCWLHQDPWMPYWAMPKEQVPHVHD
jgi:excinuclease UvrABC nuclease subunit